VGDQNLRRRLRAQQREHEVEAGELRPQGGTGAPLLDDPRHLVDLARRRQPVAPGPRQAEREPAPRTTPEVELAPDAEPSTGSDPATVKTTGVEFPYPEYLRNIVAQVYRRWHRPEANVSLRAEVMFLVHRDGSVSGVRFIQRSGNFTFDLEAQGAIEAAANSLAFGPLPAGYGADVLPVNFFFDPSSAR